MPKSLRVREQARAYGILSNDRITAEQIEKELELLRKKIFIYETLQAEKEIKRKQAKGPFKNGKEIIEYVKR